MIIRIPFSTSCSMRAVMTGPADTWLGDLSPLRMQPWTEQYSRNNYVDIPLARMLTENSDKLEYQVTLKYIIVNGPTTRSYSSAQVLDPTIPLVKAFIGQLASRQYNLLAQRQTNTVVYTPFMIDTKLKRGSVHVTLTFQYYLEPVAA